MTMIELAVAMAIVAILAALAAPSFRDWFTNNQIRNAAEAIQTGLQLARAEAVKRNTSVRFQRTTTLDSGCAIGGNNWIVSIDDPSGLCGNGLINDDYAISDTTNNPGPRIIKKYLFSERNTTAQLTFSQNTIVFNGIGRVTPVPGASINITVTNPTGGTCKSAGGIMRCLNIVVSAGGQIRMCDPSYSLPDPRGC